MGYEVHITRKENWFDEEGPTLSKEEWLNYVSQDHELRTHGFNDPDCVVWATDSKQGVLEDIAWFYYFEDRIATKNPDPEIEVIKKMYEIAVALGAQVQGDDGEIYGADGKWLVEYVPYTSTSKQIKKSWWRFW